jgi:hypothetical protein
MAKRPCLRRLCSCRPKCADVSGEHRFDAAGRDLDVHQVAEGMQQGHQTQPGEQKDQGVAEAQVVVDGADQHQAERRGEGQAGPRRQDIDAALGED